MKVIDNANSDELLKVAEGKFIKDKSTVKTDGFSAYRCFSKRGFTHEAVPVKGGKASKILPWVHTLIGNVKSTIQGIFHGVSSKHLQRFLDEYCYRFNRRFKESELFDRLLTAYAEPSR